jgi:hypothetical protein
VQFIPLTSKTKTDLPVHVRIGVECGIEKESIALPEQEVTIDKTDLIKKAGELDYNTIMRVQRAVSIQKGLTDEPFDIFRVKNLIKKLVLKYGIEDIKSCVMHPIALDEFKHYCNLYGKNYIDIFEKYKYTCISNSVNEATQRKLRVCI